MKRKYVIPLVETIDADTVQPLLDGSLTIDIDGNYNGTDEVNATEYYF